jgi:hypothetical protein
VSKNERYTLHKKKPYNSSEFKQTQRKSKTIFTYIKGLNLMLSGKDTRKVEFRNNIYKNAAELYKKRLKIKKI